jgi:hypothetical protein
VEDTFFGANTEIRKDEASNVREGVPTFSRGDQSELIVMLGSLNCRHKKMILIETRQCARGL